jgi:hypothetical protein
MRRFSAVLDYARRSDGLTHQTRSPSKPVRLRILFCRLEEWMRLIQSKCARLLMRRPRFSVRF